MRSKLPIVSHELGEILSGCGGGEGNQSCSLAKCTTERKVGEFCTDCPQFPCQRFEEMEHYNSFVPHSWMVRDLERAEELGVSVYITQLEERRMILDQLLAGYNDGRRKSFYCLAVCLLELDDLRRAFEQIQALLGNLPIKEKAITAVAVLKKTAEASGVVLKLNKKPKEK